MDSMELAARELLDRLQKVCENLEPGTKNELVLRRLLKDIESALTNFSSFCNLYNWATETKNHRTLKLKLGYEAASYKLARLVARGEDALGKAEEGKSLSLMLLEGPSTKIVQDLLHKIRQEVQKQAKAKKAKALRESLERRKEARRLKKRRKKPRL